MAWPRPWRGGGRAGPESFQVRTAHPALQASFFPEARGSQPASSIQRPERPLIKHFRFLKERVQTRRQS